MKMKSSNSQGIIIKLRAVLDINVFLAAVLSKNPKSPNKEILYRWSNNEFILLISNAISKKLVEKLFLKKVPYEKVIQLMTDLLVLAEWINVEPDDIKTLIPNDAEDDLIIACAIKGNAQFLVTYDPDFQILGNEYQGIKIVEPLVFLTHIMKKQIKKM